MFIVYFMIPCYVYFSLCLFEKSYLFFLWKIIIMPSFKYCYLHWLICSSQYVINRPARWDVGTPCLNIFHMYCTYHKVCHVGEQPEQIFDPNPPYGTNMVTQVHAIWSRHGCCCCHLVSRGAFLVVHVESFFFCKWSHRISAWIPMRREDHKGGGGGN